MGYHILLHCTAIIEPEYIDFLKPEYLYYHDIREYDYETNIPEPYHDLFLVWRDVQWNGSYGPYGSHGVYQWKMEGDQLTFELCKRPYFYKIGQKWITLENDYRRLMRDFIAPISSEILRCEIEHDDFGLGSTTYTDEEVREFHVD